MQSLAIIRALPHDWKQQLEMGKPTAAEVNNVLIDLKQTHRCAHWAYNTILTRVEEPERAKQKWESDLRTPQNASWTEIFKRMYKSTQDFSLRWFQF